MAYTPVALSSGTHPLHYDQLTKEWTGPHSHECPGCLRKVEWIEAILREPIKTTKP